MPMLKYSPSKKFIRPASLSSLSSREVKKNVSPRPSFLSSRDHAHHSPRIGLLSFLSSCGVKSLSLSCSYPPSRLPQVLLPARFLHRAASLLHNSLLACDTLLHGSDDSNDLVLLPQRHQCFQRRQRGGDHGAPPPSLGFDLHVPRLNNLVVGNNRRLLPLALAGIDRRLLLGSTVGSCWDRLQAVR
jgi:hypothetical protein